ncbi:MAG: hypothetical protein UT13_C0001G0822 [Candidatus Pacebacteria bacterium GW2011_GWF2_38_9]|nr:MAG: hypothetical protein US01_C0001G0857 [candidate division TM6 bacterium GW2011_GWF2_28_16]KKQ07838.1 MAG: hypothetical protein US20_C0028G0017 [Candidatus Pacebacteria bacterium GW2011_GWF1_36_5]KKQ89174.1 MAG: hypothetical protein UT13_C0001G0822 [Candidatus Pacebacteria bacterium GW2011_GWF2_38_9]
MPKNPEANISESITGAEVDSEVEPKERPWSDNVQKIMDEEITPERQLEVSRKYGVPEEVIATVLDKNASDEDKDKAFGKILEIIGSAIYAQKVDVEDYKIANAIIGNRI